MSFFLTCSALPFPLVPHIPEVLSVALKSPGTSQVLPVYTFHTADVFPEHLFPLLVFQNSILLSII